ncbi:MAG: hypothetical protein LH631_14675 [Alkalinema sp. CAN_BIN05]|nr:hypothetical protein [Alkalinema sp. CAN_BIN05]
MVIDGICYSNSKNSECDGFNIKKRSRSALKLNKQDDRVEHKLNQVLRMFDGLRPTFGHRVW